jgi:VWFA-related protein
MTRFAILFDRGRWALRCAVLGAMAAAGCVPPAAAQANQEGEPFAFRMAVDEVSVTFHAADARGAAVNDLKVEELKLLDNGRPPRRVVSFQLLADSSLRAGILLDTSESMVSSLAANRAIASRLVQRLAQQKTNEAFVLNFGYVSKLAQPWTGIAAALDSGIGQAVAGRENPLGGTALYDTIFRACFNLMGKMDHGSGGNFLLLFSDGVDNASHTSLEEAADQCQKSNTAIYAFHSEAGMGAYSSGPKTLAELAAQTGGRVFLQDEPDTAVESDLAAIEADVRNQYRLIYNPAMLRPDGSFHRIQLLGPDRAAMIVVRSGYYAPKQ